MKSCFAAFGFFIMVALILTVSVTPAIAITWGELDTGNKYPNVGAIIVRKAPPSGVLFQACSGTLISETVFLTAGHCTYRIAAGLATGLYDAVFVSFDLDVSSPDHAKLYPVDGIITHPEYSIHGNGPNSDVHDVGLLILGQSPPGITPAELPKLGLLDELKADRILRQGSNGAKFTVVGYGAILWWPPPRYAHEYQRRFAVSEYQALLPALLRMSQNHATGNGGICGGDSGGPTFWTDESGKEWLAAINHWTSNCVASEFNYRTDIPQTQNFICDYVPELPVCHIP